MAIIIKTTAEVRYFCTLSEEDSNRVREYAIEHDCELIEAVKALYMSYSDNHIDIYADSDESDFNTKSIDSAEEEDDDY